MIWKYIWKFYLREYSYFLLILLGSSIGVASIISMDRAIEQSLHSFELHQRAFSASPVAYLEHESGEFQEAEYFSLKNRLNFMHSKPVLEGDIQTEGVKLKVWGEDPVANLNFSEQLFGPLGESDFGPADLLTTPNSILVFEGFSLRDRIRDGKLLLNANGRTFDLNVIGIIEPKNPELSQVLKNTIYTDVPLARSLLGKENVLNKVGLDFKADQEKQLLDLLQEKAFQGFVMVKTESRIQFSKSLSSSLNLNLKALSLLALLVGLFIIFNAMTFLGFKRQHWQGILLCLGMTRREIFWLGIFESFLLGMMGGVLGILLSIPLDWWIGGFVSEAFREGYFEYNVKIFAPNYLVYLKGFLLAITVTLVSGFFPALESSRSSLNSVVRKQDKGANNFRSSLFWGLAGIVILSASRLLFETTTELFYNLVILFVSVFGLCVLLPNFFGILVLYLRRFAFGYIKNYQFRFAAGALYGSSKKLKILFTALVLAVSVALSVEIMLESVRQNFLRWMDSTLSEEIYLKPVGQEKFFPKPDWASSKELMDGVSRAKYVFRFEGFFRGNEVNLFSYSVPKGKPLKHFIFKIPPSEQGKENYISGNGLFISEVFANKFNVAPGDTIHLIPDLSPKGFLVEAVYKDFSGTRGTVAIGPGLFGRAGKNYAPESFGMTFKNQDILRRFEKKYGESIRASGLHLVENQKIRTQAKMVLERSMAATQILSYLTLLVALTGCVSAFLLMRHDQENNFSILRQMGCGKNEIKRMAFYQAILLGTTVALAGILPGFYFAWIEIDILNLKAFGWTLDTYFHWSQIALLLMVCPLALALTARFFPEQKSKGGLQQ